MKAKEYLKVKGIKRKAVLATEHSGGWTQEILDISEIMEDYAKEKTEPLEKQIKELREDIIILRDKLFFDGRKKV